MVSAGERRWREQQRAALESVVWGEEGGGPLRRTTPWLTGLRLGAVVLLFLIGVLVTAIVLIGVIV